MKKRILSILLTLCMVLCLVPTAVFAEGNEDTPTQALTSVDITFPQPEAGKEIGDGSAASANADSGLNLYLFGPALWQQGSEPKKLKANDTYEKDNIYLLNFTFYTQKPITDETALTFNGNPITRHKDYQELTEALNAYDGKEDAYLGFVMFSEEGTDDPSMKDLKNIYVVGLYALVRAQEAQTPEDTVKEQFNLDPDGTYYFDLYGESIPGTANDSLPDKTMHYVPFTYAGTVDAYKLISEMAPNEEYAKNNKYAHSLFVADYAVTKDVSRDALNTAKLIFGKNYASGGVDYTLRAPSVGSGSTGSGESRRVTPQNNEWDKMLDKDDKYIKNWGKMFSWGQDTWSTSAPRCAVRGYDSARYGDHHSSWYNYVGLGFRPVLEVLNPDTLDSDGLKAVTLNLGGGKLGDSSEEIQIIVKTGSEFAAPASEGLTRPDGNNEDYFKWLGSDGNLYAPDESVPADVTKLTALFYEQFNLALGGTYYFDLSGESIPGTVNDALPDKTMHYVPFTYAGTVDAYKLTSEKETTEEYAQQNKNPHSLFIADYAVKHTVSWDDLNTANLIFGKNYATGGVNYTLRAPSVGSDRTGLNESQRGTPQSNEWDKLLDKNDGYIKNWNWMASWGQDTRPDNSTPFHAVRGFHSARGWEFNSSSHRNVTLGFRPVLEVLNPGSLGADGLKAVTLNLGGGKLGGSAEDIQIIVKNGSEFTAPASNGLTRPDGNTEDYFKWLGSDGNLYAPGESVPANVNKMTAQFAGGSGGSGGGGGSRKPSVTYYTLHFETNGGSAITDMREANNTRISLTKYVPTRHGHTFIGWYSDQSLTNQISEVSLTKNMTVYAGWRADENPDIVVNPFTDVSEKDWFYNDAMFVYKNGLMLGTSKTLFSPHGTVTRGMMATILWRMEGSLAPKDENSFTDVEAGRWYADAITWTTENGIFAGYSKDKFGPDDPITREQLTAIFYRYADYKGYKLTVTGNLDKFEDADKITDYAKMVMQWAVGNGLIKGKSENLLDPQGTATRAEISAMLHRFIEKATSMQTD
ncbi:S-layer homology domain-containing protein [Anaerotignum faecicola]